MTRPASAPASAPVSAPTSTTADTDKTVDSYIANLGDWRGKAIAILRQIIHDAAPEAEAAIKWAQPVFSLGGPFCYIKAFRNHVNFGFWRGRELRDPASLLVGKGGMMAHVKLTRLSDVRAAELRALVEQAVALNRSHGDPTRRST